MKVEADIKRCIKCGLPENYPGLIFDGQGKCNVCQHFEASRQRSNCGANPADLEKILARHRSQHPKYDCIVPVSGGKDGLYALYLCRRVHNLRTLAVNFDNGFQTPQALTNMKEAAKRLGSDLMTLSPNWEDLKLCYREYFLRTGEFCLPCNQGMAHTIYRLAEHEKVPLIIFGYVRKLELSPIYGSKRFCREKLFVKTLTGAIPGELIEGFRIDPIKNRMKFEPISIYDYYDWDADVIFKILKDELNWQEAEHGWDKADCRYFPIACYFAFKRNGFSRRTLSYSALARAGYLAREDAVRHITGLEGEYPEQLMADFMKEMDLTPVQIEEALEKNRLSYLETSITEGRIKTLKDKINTMDNDREKIEAVLDLIRPDIKRDGGDIVLEKVSGDAASVEISFKGDCRGCYLNHMVMKNYIDNILGSYLPQKPEVTVTG